MAAWLHAVVLRVLAVAVVVAGVLMALAVNPATEQLRWPWGLDVIRRYPFPSVAILLIAAVALAMVQPMLHQRVSATAGDPPAPPPPIVEPWWEPWNNALTEQIVGVHLENGQHHAAARRFGILTEHLALLGMKPSVRLVSPMESSLIG